MYRFMTDQEKREGGYSKLYPVIIGPDGFECEIWDLDKLIKELNKCRNNVNDVVNSEKIDVQS